VKSAAELKCGWRLALVVAMALAPAPLLAQVSDASAEAQPAKITDKKHPDYVRCKSEEILGTRAQFRRVCKTNKQWADASATGGRAEREALNRASTIGGLTPQ
jgi:hypothetical protein